MADDEYAREHAAEQFDVTMSAVKRFFDREQYDKALPFCNRAIEMRPDCPVVRRSRVFALMNLSKWSDALQACEKLTCSEEPFFFEKAYCLYRLNNFEEALEALKKDKVADEAQRKKLEAQIRYRMGDYEECATIYEDLYNEDVEETGLLVNALASHISGSQPRDAMQLMGDHEELLESSYELCFNLACALIDEGKLEEAQERLEEAKKICMEEIIEAEELNEEEAAQLDDHEDLAAINVQRALVLQRRGSQEDQEKANEMYNRVLGKKGGQDREIDVTVLAVASNNTVTLRSKGKLLDALKRISIASKESLEHKLTKKQRLDIAVNRILLLLQGSRLDEARRECQRLAKEFPKNPRVAVAQAAVAYRDKKAKGAEDAFQAYLSEHPGDEEVLVCLAQLHLQQKRDEKAAEALAQLSGRGRAKPHIAQAIVAMHMRQKNPEKAVASLREAIDYWTKEEESEKNLAQILRMASRLGDQTKDRSLVADSFKLYLERVDGSDTEALCGLVKALASSDPESAEEYAQRLKVPDWVVDPEELEMQPIPKISQHIKAGAGGAAEELVKKKKKKKPRYPKDYDPANPGPPPDPERWLPKHQRTEYLKKMKKRDKNLLRGPQGSVPTDDNAFRKTGPSTAQIDLKDSAASRPKGNTGKRKGKK